MGEEELITEMFKCYERHRTVGVCCNISNAGYTQLFELEKVSRAKWKNQP